MSEEISREEIAALLARGEEMTREELRDYVEEQRSRNNIPYHVYSALIDGIDTLEQEPCEDAISRQAMHIELEKWITYGEYEYSNATKYLYDRIDRLPPVAPKQRTGHWIKHNTFEKWECSCCGVQFRFPFKEHYFCPNCGANVEEQK